MQHQALLHSRPDPSPEISSCCQLNISTSPSPSHSVSRPRCGSPTARRAYNHLDPRQAGAGPTLPATPSDNSVQTQSILRPPLAIQILTMGPAIDSGLFTLHFSIGVPALGSSFVPAVYYTNALAQQTTLVNRLFECIEIQCASDEVS
ncbi:hypothetical protein ACFXTI_003691 [Malus domestica]